MVSPFVVALAGNAWNLGVNFISGVAAFASSDVELAIGVTRSTVVNFVA